MFWAMLSLLVAVMACMFFWMSVSSANFILIANYSYDAATQTFTLDRKVDAPWDIRARWRTQAYGNGLQCPTETGESLYERYKMDKYGEIIHDEQGKPIDLINVRFAAAPMLLPCLSDPDASVITQWEVKVFGPIYLRPTYRYIPPRVAKENNGG